jgi:hypothetical protein
VPIEGGHRGPGRPERRGSRYGQGALAPGARWCPRRHPSRCRRPPSRQSGATIPSRLALRALVLVLPEVERLLLTPRRRSRGSRRTRSASASSRSRPRAGREPAWGWQLPAGPPPPRSSARSNSVMRTTAEFLSSESKRRASAALPGRARPAGGLRPASASAPAGSRGGSRPATAAGAALVPRIGWMGTLIAPSSVSRFTNRVEADCLGAG